MAREFFKWDDSYSVGLQLIDEQHKNLINLINKLYDAFIKKEHQDIITEIVQELEDYTKYHFNAEEAIFTKSDIKIKSNHLKEHKEFISKVNEFKEKVNKNKGALTYELMSFLRNWLKNHILFIDKNTFAELKKIESTI